MGGYPLLESNPTPNFSMMRIGENTRHLYSTKRERAGLSNLPAWLRFCWQ